MSVPNQVLPDSRVNLAALNSAQSDDESHDHDRQQGQLNNDVDDDSEGEFDAERTVFSQTTAGSCSSSLYKEDALDHKHTHGDLFLTANGLGRGLDEIQELPVPTSTTARRRSSAAAHKPRRSDLFEDQRPARSVAEKGVSSSDDDEEKQVAEWTYPDGGRRAWLVVLGCHIYAGTTMGFGLTWGAFQEYYVTNSFPNVNESTVTLVGGLCAFTMNATCFFGGRLGDKFGYKRMLAIGSFFCWVSAFVMAWTTERLVTVFIFQGFLNGFALGFCMPIAMALPSQWFLKRRGLATGLATSGSGIIGGIATIYVRLILVKLGPRYTLLISSFINGSFYILAFFLVDGVWKSSKWYSFCLSIFFSVYGFIPPFFFITTYTKETVPALAHSGSLKVSAPLIAMNFAGGLGRILAGLTADRLGPVNSFFGSLFLGGLFQIFVWQFAHSFDSIVGFSVAYGLFGNWFLGLLPVVAASLFDVDNLATIVGFGTLCNAPGQFASGSIGGVLKEQYGWRALILFSGCAMSGGSTIILWARFATKRKLLAKV